MDSQVSGPEWAGLIIQGVAAAAAAVAAGFSWGTAHGLKKQRERENRVAESQRLNLIHQQISEVARTLEEAPAETLWAQMRLRAELVVTTIRLPKCVQLVEVRWTPDTAAQLSGLASAAIAEVETAQKIVWEGMGVEGKGGG